MDLDLLLHPQQGWSVDLLRKILFAAVHRLCLTDIWLILKHQPTKNPDWEGLM